MEKAAASLTGNSNERAEEKERNEKDEAAGTGLRSANASTGTHATPSLPSEGVSTGSPHRYSPVTPPPRTVSKSKAPLENSVRSIQTLPSPPNSPPKSRRSEDGAASASDGEASTKSGRRRARNAAAGGGDMPGLDLFMSRNGGGVAVDSTSRSDSADDGGARAPSRASSQDNEKSSRRRTRILGTGDLNVLSKQLSDSPPPSPLPPPSPMNAASHANSPSTPSFQTTTSHESEPESQRVPQARKKSTDDDEKNRKRRTGVVGDWTLAVNAQGNVVASPSPLKSEFDLSKHIEDVPSIHTPPQKVHSPEPLFVDEPEEMPPVVSQVKLQPEQEPEVSSLYDRGSVYSTSTNSHGLYGDDRMSMISGPIINSSRLTASEDGGLGLGIGLTMLQDMADADSGSESGSDYGDDSTGKLGSVIEGTQLAEDAQVPPTPRPVNSTEGQGAADVDSSCPTPLVNAFTSSASSETHEDSREEGEDEEEEEEAEWDDEEFYGEDFYDNYRYSRYSMMSKVSKRKSRFSVMTSREPESPLSMSLPPMPAVRERKDSGSSSLRSYPSPTEEKDKKGKHVPPPLNLVPSAPAASLLSPTTLKMSSTPTITSASSSGGLKSDTAQSEQFSPLLHTNFASPLESSSRATSLGTPLLSPVPSISSFSSRSGASPGNVAAATAAGAASALRQKLENERGLSPSASPVPGSNPRPDEGLGNGIVVEDDDEIHVEIVSADQSRADTTIVANQSRVSVDSMASASVESGAPSVASTSTDVTREMHRIEADLARVLENPSANSSMSSLPTGGDPRTPTASEYAMGPTQPLRLQERPTQRPGLPLALQQGQPQLQQVPPTQLAFAPPTQQQPQQMAIPRPQPRAQLTPEQALFRPHPNAPPPNPAVVSGQRTSTYGMPPVHAERPAQMSPHQNTLFQAMRMAAVGRMGPNGVPRNTTIYGKTVIDLSNSIGPVAMVWSIDPFPVEPARTNSPGPGRGVPRRSTTAGASPLSTSVTTLPTSTPTPPPMDARATPSPPQMNRATPSPSPASSPAPPSPGIDGENRGSRVVPRANFHPQVGAPRPRSRSFSGLSSQPATGPIQERSNDDVSRPTRSASYQSLKQASAPSSRPGSHAPSPLSLPHNNTVNIGPRSPGLPPPSPLSRPPLSPIQHAPPAEEAPQNAGKPVKKNVLRKVASAVSVRSDQVPSPSDRYPPPPAPLQSRRSNSDQAGDSAGSSPPSGSASVLDKLRRISSSGSGKKHQRTVSQQSQSSSSSDTTRSNVISPPLVRESSGSTMRRSNSLKAKLSLSHLRLKKDTVPENDVVSPTTAPSTPMFEFDEKPETVHVQDAEFEMVTPVILRNSSETNSPGSVHTRDERPSIQSDFRAVSPATLSMRSARSPLANGKLDSPTDGSQAGKLVEDAATVEAHRARELKWISAMSSIPANQARKNKKVRKLVIEGVPSSVRYLVWAHLADSKSKRIPGVYGQLGKRGKVTAIEAIERDAQRCFPDQAHLRDPKGPLVNLLQTYLTMVPDIEYQTSTCIIGYRILQ